MEELARLQGIWNFVSLELEGTKVPEDALESSHIVIKGDRFVTRTDEATYEGTLRLDITRNPKTIDLRFSDGPETGEASLGIYTLEDDTWTICLGLAGCPRPTEFATKPDSGHALETLERRLVTSEG